MDVKIKGNPGNGNSYEDVNMQHVDNYNPNAKESITHIHYESTDSRLACWFRKLKEEFENDVRLQPHTIGLEQKLLDGGFSKTAIDQARRKKQYYAKKTTKYQYYESAQRIDSYLFAIVCNRFDNYVTPLIEDSAPLRTINQTVYEQVVIPIMRELNSNGSDDTYLCYSEDDIFGMIYYLTGNCHINWKKYDI